MARVLVVEDDANLRHVLKELLSHDYDVTVLPDAESAVARMKKEDFSLLLTDLRLPGMSGIELVKKARETSPHTVSIILTGHATIESAVEAMKHGAYNYLAKPFGGDNLLVQAKRALEFHDLRKENASLKQQVGQGHSPDDIIWRSPAMAEVMGTMRKVSESSSAVLITGESGTGKELVARIIHCNSRRSSYPFVAVNCGAIPSELMESELFGHEKGAFTGAVASHAGRFERAEGGSIFLDEIGELPYGLQVKLLRVLQEKEYERVGGARTMKADVRVMAATNRDMEELVEKKAFREDLYYRLNVIPIHIPPLRERQEDIPLLAEHFLKASALAKRRPFRGIEPEAMEMLKKYHWPGNIRELQNMAERVVILKEDDNPISTRDIPAKIRSGTRHPTPEGGVDLAALLDKVEREYILSALERAGGVKTRAAELLGINRTTLIEKMRKMGITMARKKATSG